MALFHAPPLSDADRDVMTLTDELRRRLRYHVAEPRRWSGLLRRVSLARAIRGSNSIEGFVVSVDDAFAALDEADDSFELSVDTIKALHFMLQSYDLAKWPGRVRPGDILALRSRAARGVRGRSTRLHG